MLYNPAALLILLYIAAQQAPADPAEPPNDIVEETAPIIQSAFDPLVLIRVRGID